MTAFAPDATAAREATGRIDLHAIALGATVCLATAGLGAANGGFYPASWGWSSLLLLWLAVVALIVGPVRTPLPAERSFALVVGLLALWTWLSIVWSSDTTSSVLEGQRVLSLVAVVAAVLALAPRRPVAPIVGGLHGGLVALCGYALLTRLLPERLAGSSALSVYRLSTPVGYWNGLGLVAAMATLLALGLAARGGRPAVSAWAAASLVVLAPTLYFTYSRGAWIALAAGLLILLALDPRRLCLTTAVALYGALPVAAVLIASRSTALTHANSSLTAAAAAGHRYGALVAVLAAAQAALAVAVVRARAALTVPRALRLTWLVVVLAATVAVAGAAAGRYGSPVTMATRAAHAFTVEKPPSQANLDARLFSLSGNGRWSLWQAAWQQSTEHPMLGAGSGTFAHYWLANRPTALQVEDAHNLYLETLAELGPAGLLLVLALIGLPLAAAVRARRHPLVPAAAAALGAYAVHAAADWDWELAGVTLAAVVAGTACILAGRETEPSPGRLREPQRRAAIAALLALSVVAFVGLLGNAAAERSAAAARSGDWQASAEYARRTTRWAPWSAVGWRRLGEAQLALGRPAAARHSLQRALAKDPGDWVLWLDLSAATTGRASSNALLRARQLNPLSPDLAGFEPNP